jgi:Arc/MetJ family transcription regulator
MRTNIDIDDRLMRQAMRSCRARTKRATVEEGLRLLIQTRGQATIRKLRGKIQWHGELRASRLPKARTPSPFPVKRPNARGNRER